MRIACLMVAAVLAVFNAAAGELENELQRRLVGAWAVVSSELYSNCSGSYNDNRVMSSGVAGKADRRFEPGELVKIDRVKTKKARVDLLVTLAEPLLVTRTDGPFELYDEKICKVQLLFGVGREAVRAARPEPILDVVFSTLTVYPSLETSQSSPAWNGREREAYPADYDDTLARYQVWQVEQTNAAVESRLTRALDNAADAVDDVRSDADYLDGFAAGVAKLRDWSVRDCSTLIGAELTTYDSNPAGDASAAYRDGWQDGQRLAFNLQLAERLPECRLTTPPAPRS